MGHFIKGYAVPLRPDPLHLCCLRIFVSPCSVVVVFFFFLCHSHRSSIFYTEGRIKENMSGGFFREPVEFFSCFSIFLFLNNTNVFIWRMEFVSPPLNTPMSTRQKSIG